MSDHSNFYDHILFIERLIENYKDRLDTSLIEDLTTQLNYIKEKQQDKLLNISVVGDFSTGKSTFINALLKCGLLEMEDLQSTTTASTIIEHANFFGIEVDYKNKEKTQKTQKKNNSLISYFSSLFSSTQNSNITKFRTIEELKNEIKNFGASIDKSKDIEKINVYLPAFPLKDIFRIIDTPGLNATDLWLEDITKSTIEKLSDASVIIVDANKILPKNFCDFIKANLSNVLSQCVFIVTKIDQIRREKERIRVLEAIKNKVELEFNLKDPLILTYVSTEILKKNKIEEGEVNSEFLQITEENERKQLDYVKNKKKEVQTKKLISMIQRLYNAISMQMKNIRTDFESELAMLMRSKQSDLKSFVSIQKDKRSKEFKDVFSELSSDYKMNCKNAGNTCVSIFLERIDEVQCKSVQELKAWCESCFEPMTKDLRKWMYDNNQLNKDAFEAFDTVALEEVRKFQKAFEQHFKDYDLLRINFDSSELAIDSYLHNSRSGFEAQKNILNQAIKNEDEALGNGVKGGVAVGAVVGTLLFGPIGGVFGAMISGSIGSFWGGFNKPNIEEVKGKIKESLKDNLHRIFTQTSDELIDNYQNNIDARCDFIRNELDRYLQSYQAEVDRRISEQENKRQYIETQIIAVELDLKDIDVHKNQILN